MIEKRYPAGILAACLLPWNERNELDAAVFRRHVRKIRDEFTGHFYLFGTAGEGYAVTDRQFERVVRLFREEADAPGLHAMIGVISLSLRTVIERIQFAREAGFREFQISLPSWGTVTDRELEAFFDETCGRFRDCRFLHYNLLRAGRILTGDDYARLAGRHPNLVAVKRGGEDLAELEDLVVKAPVLQFFFTDFGYAGMRDRHECGLLSAVSATNFERAKRFFAARGPELAAFAAELRQVHRAAKAAATISGCHMDGAYDKLYARLHDPEFPLRLLPPYEGIAESAFVQFASDLPRKWANFSH